MFENTVVSLHLPYHRFLSDFSSCSNRTHTHLKFDIKFYSLAHHRNQTDRNQMIKSVWFDFAPIIFTQLPSRWHIETMPYISTVSQHQWKSWSIKNGFPVKDTYCWLGPTILIKMGFFVFVLLKSWRKWGRTNVKFIFIKLSRKCWIQFNHSIWYAMRFKWLERVRFWIQASLKLCDGIKIYINQLTLEWQ